MTRVGVISGNFMDLVSQLASKNSETLYENQFVCEAILRSLPPLSKQYVLRLLYVDTMVQAKVIVKWVLPDEHSKHKAAIDKLLQLKVFVKELDRKRKDCYKMNPKFQSQLRRTIANGSAPPGKSLSTISNLDSAEELEKYALKQWEEVLLFLAKPVADSKSSESFLITFFRQAGFLISHRDSLPKLTAKGFQFLLLDTISQLWYIIREYILTTKDGQTADFISFLLELGFHIIGKPYSMSHLTRMQQKVIEELAVFGLLRCQKKEKYFVPTKLALTLGGRLSDSWCQKPAKGFIIVETNFKLYAYSTSKLHYNVLHLFMRIEYQLCDLVVGAITRENMYAAFDHGITAEQIIQYLSKNAHPRIAQREPRVPENIIEQLKLWEKDRNRVDITPACIYVEFSTEGNEKEAYEEILKHSKEMGAFLWKHRDRKQLVVKQEKDDDMRNFIGDTMQKYGIV